MARASNQWRIGMLVEDDITMRSDQLSKVQSLHKVTISQRNIKYVIPFCLGKVVYIFWCFKFKIFRCSYSIVRFGNQCLAIFFLALSMSFCFNHSTRNDWDQPSWRSFFIQFELGFSDLLTAKTLVLPKRASIQRYSLWDSIRSGGYHCKERYTRFHFHPDFQIFNTEIFCSCCENKSNCSYGSWQFPDSVNY